MVLVVDAKYKSHWDEIERAERWTSVDEDLRDAHREDLLQVLAYTTAQTAAPGVGGGRGPPVRADDAGATPAVGW
ncbi:hypothetical protein [Candidatus Amarobacter glycogenicus]|uniref:hypothetical protein n=1 Tax=Candidatus Amarobacter glycogenicus TaxID=3140699 RepID=UPI003135CF15|nr:hypothetical protein [Dehalococcoidia bacterium]